MLTKLISKIHFFFYAVCSKIIRALAIMHVIFLWFACKYLICHACCKQYKA